MVYSEATHRAHRPNSKGTVGYSMVRVAFPAFRSAYRTIRNTRLNVCMSSNAKPSPCRNLHWVFKIGERRPAIEFFQDTLGMHVLRHEEFAEGCEASCNGPYDGRWSKTMIGYADEDSSFVLELTYNYGVKTYDVGNDFKSITIKSKSAFKAASRGSNQGSVLGTVNITSPDGYEFIVQDEDVSGPNPVTQVTLHVQDLSKSLAYWNGFLGFQIDSQEKGTALLRTGPSQTALRLTELPAGTAINRGTGFGRIAFACPGEQLQRLEADVKAAGYTVHTPYVSLDTPGKATVQVVILSDPDGHEICFVGEAGFRDLSRVDPEAGRMLSEAMDQDNSSKSMWDVE